MEELVIKAKKGDTEAYTQLMLNIRNDLYKICKTRISSNDEIDDIIQETMIQTFKYIKKLKDNTKFKQWIIKILINNCNKLYKNNHKIHLSNFEIDYKQGLKNNIAVNDIENIENDINFYQLLSNLKYEERIIIILYYSEKFTLKEISKILRISENTVKTRLYRAKQKIKLGLECKGGM